MDGIKNTRPIRSPVHRWMQLIAFALVAAPLFGAPPVESSRRQSLTRFQPTAMALDAGTYLSNRPTTIRPPARVIDARHSPLIAVVSGTDSVDAVAAVPASNNVEVPLPVAAPNNGPLPSPGHGSTTRSASDRPPTVEEALQTRGSVTFRKTPISEVVFMLSDLWRINIVAGADVIGDVSGAFQDAPLSEVLSAALTASGYGYRQIGNSLVVLPVGEIESGPTGNTGFAVSNESGIAYFSPQFTEAEQMAEPLQMALGQHVIVAVYPEENRIMVKGSADDLRIAREAIQQLDVPRPQVRITAMIYDVSLGELEKLGVNWNRQVRELANGENEALAEVTRTVSEFFDASADLTTTGATIVGLRTINDSLNASVFLEALDSNAEAKLLADPSITVGDRTQASIRIVQQIPIVGANPVEGSNAVFTQTEFKEAGVILNVLPRISRDGTIQLQVQPEYSVVSEITTAGPVIDTRTADTIVRVNDGQMFVLGGLRQKTIIESVRGVPYLREIKLIGKLFRAHSTEVRESELIVFLKPELITPYYAGHPREQMAACVASDQLDRIPHAQTASIIPCCKDPYCPNHHPRIRANLGSYAFEMIGGAGLGQGQIVSSEVVEMTGPTTPAAADSGQALADPPTRSEAIPVVPGAPATSAPTLQTPQPNEPALQAPAESIPPPDPELGQLPTGRSELNLQPVVVEDLYRG